MAAKYLWVKHGYNTASVVLKRKVLGVKFNWCSDSDSWLERVMVAHREGWDSKEPFSDPHYADPIPLARPVLVDALVWRFSRTREHDSAVGGMIMSPRKYIRTVCEKGRAVNIKCRCMWCSKYAACHEVHKADMAHDKEFPKGVELPAGELGKARGLGVMPSSHHLTFNHLGKLSKHEAPEAYTPPPPVKPEPVWTSQHQAAVLDAIKKAKLEALSVDGAFAVVVNAPVYHDTWTGTEFKTPKKKKE